MKFHEVRARFPKRLAAEGGAPATLGHFPGDVGLPRSTCVAGAPPSRRHAEKPHKIGRTTLSNFLLLTACWLLLFSPATLLADAETDWGQVLALDAGPKAGTNSPEQFKTATLQHLELQEKALRGFLSAYPGDAHDFAASLRLAHLLAVRSDLKASSTDWGAAMKILDELERKSSPEQRADVAFARISLSMGRMKPGDNSAQESLLAKARGFQQNYPQDRRVGRLLVEIATLYDDQPAKKESLLQEALVVATDVETQRRIEDDLKRTALVDKPLDLQFISTEGKSVDLKEYRGKFVFVVFFSEWSAPSIKAVQEVQTAIQRIPQARALGISLNRTEETLSAFIKSRSLDWPVYFDGKGWNSPLVRGWGINSLPTVWLVDRNGILRRLNVRGDWEGAIRRAM